MASTLPPSVRVPEIDATLTKASLKLKGMEVDGLIETQDGDTHRTDDPVEAEDFLMNLLIAGARISSIKHEGIELDQPQSDRMLRVAAWSLALVALFVAPATVRAEFKVEKLVDRKSVV